MDMIFRDEECRIRTEHAPANFTTLKHMAHKRWNRLHHHTAILLVRRCQGVMDITLLLQLRGPSVYRQMRKA